MICDDSGTVSFKVKVTGGNELDTFPIIVSFSASSNADTAKCVVGGSTITVVKFSPKVANKVLPAKIRMKMQIGPNPFKPASGEVLTIELAPGTSNTSIALSGMIKIFDCMGNVVKTQSIGKSSGKLSIRWDGKNMDGRIVSAGTYYLKLNIVNENANNNQKIDLPAGIFIGVKR